MHFGAIANSARGGPPRPPPVRDRVKIYHYSLKYFEFSWKYYINIKESPKIP